MKYYKFILAVVFALLFFTYECSAFDNHYKYNYEITAVDFNGQTGTLSGWAILNAGVNDGSSGSHKSPGVNRKLGSTASKSYSYSLRVYAINLDGGTEQNVGYIEATQRPVTKKLNLYGVMCHRNSGGSCVESRSSYYTNVNFSFSYDFANFYDSSKFVRLSNLGIDGYKFVLTIKSTQSGCTSNKCIQTFSLAFLEKAVSESAKKYFDSSSYLNRVDFVANSAYVRSRSCGNGSRVAKIKTAGGNYKIYNTTYCNGKQMTYYQIKHGNKGWVPASWIAPPSSQITRIIPSACNVDGDSLRFNGVTNEVVSKSCESFVNLSDNLEESCITADKSNYYTISCKDNIQTEFSPSKTKYYRGDDFELEAKITSQVTCTGTFNYNLWSNAYSKADDNGKKILDDIKNNFTRFTMNDYSNTPTGVMTYSVDKKNATMALKIVSDKKIEERDTKADVTYTSASKVVPKSLVYKTSKREVIMNLNNPIVVDEKRESTPYQVVISNVGYSSKSKVNFDCEIEKILAIYRPIDIGDPFISTNKEREVGRNWKNDKYSFVNIIDENVWKDSNKPQYVFVVSRKNITAITKNNNDVGTGAYFGSQCSYNTIMHKYYCPFLRDKNYFTNSYIDGSWQ